MNDWHKFMDRKDSSNAQKLSNRHDRGFTNKNKLFERICHVECHRAAVMKIT